MKNFSFKNPTQILFGEGQIAEIANVIPADARVMLIYGGGSIKGNGVYEQIQTALGDRIVTEFAGVEANPEFTTLCRAADKAREHNVTYLLAAGGGSVIDGTKFIAAAACFEGDPWEIMLKGGRNIEQVLPFGSVLTLPATGSEMNSGSVVNQIGRAS